MKAATLDVGSMLSALDYRGVERQLGRMPGVLRVTASSASNSATVEYDETVTGVAALKDNHRRAIELRYLRGLPVAEVAEMMGTTPHAIHSLCHRALQELHAVMGRSAQYLTRK